MYVLLPLTGAALALIFYIVVGAGLFTLAGTQPGFTIVGLAALVGMFSTQAAQKLKDIAEGLFARAPVSSDHLTVAPTLALSSISTGKGPQAGGTPITLKGAGFAAGLKVAFGTKAATDVKVVNDTEASAITPPADAVGAVDVSVAIGSRPPAVVRNAFTYE